MARQKAPKESTTDQTTPRHLWHSGRLVEWEKATVHVTSIGWPAISAVFEGIRGYWNADQKELYVFQLDAHLKRLAQSMKLMRMLQTYSMEQVREAILDLLRANEIREDAYVQPLVYFSERLPGYLAATERPVDMYIVTRPATSQLGRAGGASACVSTWARLADNVMPPRAKAITNYQNSRLISTEAQINGYDYGLVLNQQGKVAEAAYACVLLVRDGVAITPPWSAGILESVTRNCLITLLEEQLKVPVLVRDVDRTELYIADEVLLCGTAVEVTPITSVDRYKIGSGRQGPVTRRVASLLRKIALGRDKRYASWVTGVYGSGA